MIPACQQLVLARQSLVISPNRKSEQLSFGSNLEATLALFILRNNRALAMGILDRGIEKWAVKLQAEEMSEFVSRLESMGGPEIGLGFAMATHWRNSLSLKRELMDPIYYVSVNPMVGHEFGKMVRKLQQRGRNFEAIGLMVWLHTLRAASSQELRGPGRRMWKELARGVPFAHESAASYLFMTGTVLETDYSALYPEGFIPEPV